MNTIDLDRPPSGHRLDVKISPDEAAGERQVRLFKDVPLFLMAAGFVILIIVFCFLTVTSVAASVDEKKWAMLVLSAAAAGLIGYLIRK